MSGKQKRREKKDKKKDDGPKKPNRSMASLLKSVLSQVKLGSDVMSQGLSLPSWLYEPITIIQRQVEVLEYHHLLDVLVGCTDSFERMCYLAAFSVSGYSSITRLLNNFNPVLGETYEYVTDDFKFFAEQVVHHPPITANYCEGAEWIWYQNASAKTNFMGNLIEIDTVGRTHFEIKETGEHFFYTNPVSRLHNLVIGKLWIQHCGELAITNDITEETCSMQFKKAGMLRGNPYYNVTGTIKDNEGNDIIEIDARWNEYFRAKYIDPKRTFSDGENEKEFWTVSPESVGSGIFNLTPFALSINDIDDTLRELIPPTDSRLRHDRIALQEYEYDESTSIKKTIEDRQRTERAEREEQELEWVPSFFSLEQTDNGEEFWRYTGDYWEQREAKLSAILNDEEIPEELLNGANAKGTACDWSTYNFEKEEESE